MNQRLEAAFEHLDENCDDCRRIAKQYQPELNPQRSELSLTSQHNTEISIVQIKQLKAAYVQLLLQKEINTTLNTRSRSRPCGKVEDFIEVV